MPDGIASRFDSVEYAGADERLLDAVNLHASTATLPRAGRRPGIGLTVTHGGSPENATVAAGAGVVTDSAGGGGYRFVIPTAVNLPMPARPGAGTSRIDFIVARIKNEDARPGDLLREVELDLISGVAAGSPTAPSLPAGNLRLAQLTVPASGSVVITKAAPRYTSVGGTLLIADATELAAIEQIYDGLLVYREDVDRFYGRQNGLWSPMSNMPACHVRRDATQNVADDTPVNISFDTGVFDNASMWDGFGTTIEIPASGRYRVTGQVGIDISAAQAGASAFLQLVLIINGASSGRALARHGGWASPSPTVASGSVTLSLDAGDTLGIAVRQNSGALRTTHGGSAYPTDLIVEMIP